MHANQSFALSEAVSNTSPADAQPVVLAEFDLEGLEHLGRVLHPIEPDWSLEHRVFPGWYNRLYPAPARMKKQVTGAGLQIVKDRVTQSPVLEWPASQPCLLVTGDDAWRDYIVTAPVRTLAATTFEDVNDEATHDRLVRSGLVARVADTRRHYFAGFEGGTKLVIAARVDSDWVTLNHTPMSADMHRYDQLSLHCQGTRLTLLVEGEPVLVAEDDRYTSGAAGVYANGPTRFGSTKITTSAAEADAIASRKAARDRAWVAASRSIPQAQMLAQVKLPPEAGNNAAPGKVVYTARGHLVISYPSSASGQVVTAIDREGKTVWRYELEKVAGPLIHRVLHLGHAGGASVLVAANERLTLLDGRDGSVMAEADFPDGSPFHHMRGQKASFVAESFKAYRTQGHNKPARLVMFEYTGAGGHTIWSYDHELRHRWTHHNDTGKYGHNLASFDVNHDGCDEILATYYALDDDGHEVWRVPGSDLVDKQEHGDNLCAGYMNPQGQDPSKDVPRIVAALGNAGALFLDAPTGQKIIHRRNLGHMQRLTPMARFCRDRSDLQLWMWTDWGSPGIFFLFDQNGNILHRFQPSAATTKASIIHWQPGSDHHLLYILGPSDVAGLWNEHGQRVVDLSMHPVNLVTQNMQVHNWFDTGAQQVLFMQGDRIDVIGAV